MAFWRAAEALLRTLHMLFGAPGDVAARHMLASKQHTLMARWLRAAEALMRRLLLIEAAALPKPNMPFGAATRCEGKRQRKRKTMAFYAHEPEKWRVSFRCFTADCRLPAGRWSLPFKTRLVRVAGSFFCRQDAGGTLHRTGASSSVAASLP